MKIFEVSLSKQAQNQLTKLPSAIAFKLYVWIDGIKVHGLQEMRKQSSFHDEPLKGDRIGQRSIRLNRAYRAFYRINKSRIIHFIDVIEINKHDY